MIAPAFPSNTRLGVLSDCHTETGEQQLAQACWKQSRDPGDSARLCDTWKDTSRTSGPEWDKSHRPQHVWEGKSGALTHKKCRARVWQSYSHLLREGNSKGQTLWRRAGSLRLDRPELQPQFHHFSDMWHKQGAYCSLTSAWFVSSTFTEHRLLLCITLSDGSTKVKIPPSPCFLTSQNGSIAFFIWLLWD